jgi:hypothetical protein
MTFPTLSLSAIRLPLLSLGLLFSALPALAQTSQGDLRLVTSPLPINLIVEPGHSISTPIRIQNQGTSTETLKVTVMKFQAYGEEGAPKLLDPEPGDDFISWVHFSEDSFTVNTNEWKTLTATFDVPDTAAFGYYYAFVFSRAKGEDTVKKGETTLNGGTAILALLEAKVPNAKREVTVTDFQVERAWYEFLPATFTVKLKNTGNVHIAPRGNLFIGRENEKEDAILEINSEKGSILPGSGRSFTAQWNDGFLRYQNKEEDGKIIHDEKGKIVKVLDWNWKDAAKLRFGKYEAKLLLVYDDGHRDVPLEGVVSFWVVPWRLIGGSSLILLLALIGLKSTLQNIWRKAFRKKKNT